MSPNIRMGFSIKKYTMPDNEKRRKLERQNQENVNTRGERKS